MAKAKKKAQKTDPEITRRGVMAGVAALVVIGIGAGAMFGAGALHERASRELLRTPGEIEIRWPALEARTPAGETSWMPASERARLRAIVEGILEGADPLSGDPIRDAGEALLATGWFSKPPTVRRMKDLGVLVTGEWRVPGAAVRTRDGDRLIAWDGAPLALLYGQGESGQRVIVGGWHAPTGDGVLRPGADGRWPSEDVLAGLELLALLRSAGLDAQVAGVNVEPFTRDKTLQLLTYSGGRVVWGGAPGAFTPGEVSDNIKLERLRTLRDRTGQIDAGKEIIEIFGPRVLLDLTDG